MDFISNTVVRAIVEIVLVVAIAAALLYVAKRVFAKYKSNADNGIPNNRKTLMRLLYSIVRIAIYVVAIFAILSSLGVNITAAVAGLGIAGACAALAVQDFLKDFIQGVNVASDNFFQIGDVINYNGNLCKVVEMTVRSVKLKSLTDGNILTVGNRLIEQAEVVSGTVNLKIPLSYEADVDRVYEVMGEIAEEIRNDPEIESCEFLGTQSFEESSILYLITLKGAPDAIYATRRKALSAVQRRLNEAGLQIPYNQIDVHMDSKD